MVLIPAYLHIEPRVWRTYPLLYRAKTREMLRRAIAHGWFGNPNMIDDPGKDGYPT